METQASIAHIHQASDEAVGAKDDAWDAISAYVPPKPVDPPKPPDGPKGPVTPPQPKPPIKAPVTIKKPRVVSLEKLKGAGYLKSRADVDAFLDKLRRELESAIAADEQIDIRIR